MTITSFEILLGLATLFVVVVWAIDRLTAEIRKRDADARSREANAKAIEAEEVDRAAYCKTMAAEWDLPAEHAIHHHEKKFADKADEAAERHREDMQIFARELTRRRARINFGAARRKRRKPGDECMGVN